MRLPQTGVRVKVLGLAIGVAVLMGVASVGLSRSAFLRTSLRELQARAESVARDVAARGADLIVTGDLYELHVLARDTLRNNPDVVYVAVLDPRGRPIAHTFPGGFPSDLLRLPLPAPPEPVHTELLATERGRILDVAVSVLGGAAGTVRVGVSEERILGEARLMADQIALAVAVAAALGTLAAFALSGILTRPLRELVAAARAVEAGDLTRRASPGPPDEFGELIQAFNDMVARLERSNAELEAKEHIRQELLQRVITAQEEERRRVARELHDETSQSLTSLTVGLRLLAQSVRDLLPPDGHTDRVEVPTRVAMQLADRANELRDLTVATLAEVHALALELRPRALDDLGLVPALERYVADFTRKHGILVDLQVAGPAPDAADGLRLPPAVETGLYRIIQEALTNVARHSGARSASVVLDVRPDQVSAIIEDDGRGFDVDAALARQDESMALGLHGMRERAVLLGGSLTIESSPSAGTTVLVRIPLKSPAEGAHRPADSKPPVPPGSDGGSEAYATPRGAAVCAS